MKKRQYIWLVLWEPDAHEMFIGAFNTYQKAYGECKRQNKRCLVGFNKYYVEKVEIQ